MSDVATFDVRIFLKQGLPLDLAYVWCTDDEDIDKLKIVHRHHRIEE